MPTVGHISVSSEQLLKSGGLPPSTKCLEGLSTLTTRQNSKVCFYIRTLLNQRLRCENVRLPRLAQTLLCQLAVFNQKLVCVRFNIYPTRQTCMSAAVKLNP